MKRALVLSGGGARGAYEAGALRYIFGPLAQRTGRDLSPDVVSGTSVGALTGAWVTALGMQAAAPLSYFWRELLPEHIYKLRLRDLVSGRDAFLQRHTDLGGGTAVFDPAPLYEHVRQALPWTNLRQRVGQGRVFSCAATDIASGRCVQFVDGAAVERVTPTSRMVSTKIGPEHVIASAAIPFVFPSVSVAGRWMVDGALRQNTPLAPALHLQCDKVLVIGVKRQRPDTQAPPNNPSPTAATLAGRALNAMMLDPVEEDLRRMERWNSLLSWAESAYPGFGARMGREHRPYRVVQAFHLRPSQDLGRLAAEIFPTIAADLPLATRLFLEALADPVEADLVSYFLFHRAYTSVLEALGYADAEAAQDELLAVL